MGLVSDAFARAREEKWVARPLRKEMDYGPPITQHPAAALWEAAAQLPKDMQKEVKEFYFQLGKLDRPAIEAGLHIFQRRTLYVNYY